MSEKSTDPRKYKADEWLRDAATTGVSTIQKRYVADALGDSTNGNVTPNDLRDEFWQVIAEHYGLTIKRLTPEGQP